MAVTADAVAVLNGGLGRDPAWWKRYRGGTSGRLWVRAAGIGGPGAAGDGTPFRRLLAGLPSQFFSPMLVGSRLAFLSDHEGTGNLYSCTLDGSDLRRHTDHDGFYARNASTDGRRVVYHCAGDIWLLDDLDPNHQPRRGWRSISARPGRPGRRGRSPLPIISARSAATRTGRASAIEVRGTVHWLTHRDGPARALSVVPGSRARLPRVLGRTGRWSG